MADTATKGKELVVEIKNDPGAAAGVLEVLGAAKINVGAMCGYGSERRKKAAFLHVICPDAAKAKGVLAKAGYKSSTNNVLLVRVSNRPGKMAQVLQAAAAKGVNLDYAYGSTIGKAGLVVLATRNLVKAMNIINA